MSGFVHGPSPPGILTHLGESTAALPQVHFEPQIGKCCKQHECRLHDHKIWLRASSVNLAGSEQLTSLKFSGNAAESGA